MFLLTNSFALFQVFFVMDEEVSRTKTKSAPKSQVWTDGADVGALETGAADGTGVGVDEGAEDCGACDGAGDGRKNGDVDGVLVGSEVGASVCGIAVGATDGVIDGK